ncbi:MAG: N-acetyltransferase [Rhodothermaceae bacterium]|nr:N-acetyltransferase [Rhodothermaceae bacterium]
MPASTASTAQIHPSVQLGEGVTVGHFCVIGADVVVGEHTILGHHVVLHAGTQLGANVRVDDHAVIGKQPMRATRSATTSGEAPPPAEVGENALIGTGVVLYAGCGVGPRVLVADYATIRERVTVGAETIVGRGVAIENDCTVGARCKLETNAYLCAYTTMEDDVFVAPGVLTSNDNFMGRTEERKQHFGGPVVRRGARLGVGAVLLPGKEVPKEAVVAAGAVLTRNATAGQVHLGLPARPIRPVPPDQLLAPDDDPHPAP